MYVDTERYAPGELVERQAPTLLDVANVLRERGWCQGTMTDEQGRHCIVGAMGELAYRRGISTAVLAANLAGHLGGSIVAWNDAPWRTKDEVIAMLEAAHANQNP